MPSLYAVIVVVFKSQLMTRRFLNNYVNEWSKPR